MRIIEAIFEYSYCSFMIALYFAAVFILSQNTLVSVISSFPFAIIIISLCYCCRNR